MSEKWYGEQFKGNLVTDTLMPLFWSCFPAALLIFWLVIWLKSR